MPLLKDFITEIEKLAPLHYQESYDNSGLIVGTPDKEISGILLTVDVTENILDQAIKAGANLIISHHPPVFHALKRFNGRSATERIVERAIKQDIALYAAHTNLDNVMGGLNSYLAQLLGLTNCKILSPLQNELYKLVTFVPIAAVETVRNALFKSNAGHIGNYDSCSFNTTGEGTFRANEMANPFVGELNKLHTEPEIRVETVVTKANLSQTIKALLAVHPYEEPAYDIIPLHNTYQLAGSGMIGELEKPTTATEFLHKVKNTLQLPCLRHTVYSEKDIISKIAVCGGSGSFLIETAIASGAEVFLTGDLKYQHFMDVGKRIILADIGHFESEYCSVSIFYDILSKKFPTFAIQIAQEVSNPVRYLI